VFARVVFPLGCARLSFSARADAANSSAQGAGAAAAQNPPAQADPVAALQVKRFSFLLFLFRALTFAPSQTELAEVKVELAEVKTQLKSEGLSEKKEEQLNARLVRLESKEILLLEEKKDLRQQQQATALAGARAQCVFARAFSGLFVPTASRPLPSLVCCTRAPPPQWQ
jgi:hypothetical protein